MRHGQRHVRVGPRAILDPRVGLDQGRALPGRGQPGLRDPGRAIRIVGVRARHDPFAPQALAPLLFARRVLQHGVGFGDGGRRFEPLLRPRAVDDALPLRLFQGQLRTR